MKLAFIGSGYVGLVSAAGYANLGNSCVCIDVDKKKVQMINDAISPIYENGLVELLSELRKNNKLRASHNYSDIKECSIIFICVGTPSKKNGSIDLSYIESSAREIGKIIHGAPDFRVVIVKSTVVPGTTLDFVLPILEEASGKKAGVDFGIAMMPEFLKEGSALMDFEKPDRIVVGAQDEKTFAKIRELNLQIKCEKFEVPIPVAEMIKYASNSFLATKISFINQLANLCDKIDLDIDLVAKGMGLDSRINPHFLKAGPGYGGSCFPKDVSALMAFSAKKGVEPTLLEAVTEINYLQPLRMIELAKNEVDLNGLHVSILGLSFKPDTDDIRESPALKLVSELEKMNCKISAYDPKAMDNFRKLHAKIIYCKSIEDALKDSRACFIVTDWKEFKKPISFYEAHMANPLIIDSRRILDVSAIGRAKYLAIGRVVK